MRIATAERTERERRDAARSEAPTVFSAAELAECTCPEWCERDHDRD